MVEGRTHRPVILPEQCHSCNVCLRGCPAEIVTDYRREQDSLRGVLYREKIKVTLMLMPAAIAWAIAGMPALVAGILTFRLGR